MCATVSHVWGMHMHSIHFFLHFRIAKSKRGKSNYYWVQLNKKAQESLHRWKVQQLIVSVIEKIDSLAYLTMFSNGGITNCPVDDISLDSALIGAGLCASVFFCIMMLYPTVGMMLWARNFLAWCFQIRCGMWCQKISIYADYYLGS